MLNLFQHLLFRSLQIFLPPTLLLWRDKVQGDKGGGFLL